MNWYRNLKIGTRILAGFAVVIAITAALGIFAYTRVTAIDASSKDMVDNAVPSIYIIGEIKADVELSHALLLKHAATSDPQQLAEIETEIQAEKTKTDSLFDKYEKATINNDKERAIFKDIYAARIRGEPGKAKVLALSTSRERRPRKAQALNMGRGETHTFA